MSVRASYKTINIVMHRFKPFAAIPLLLTLAACEDSRKSPSAQSEQSDGANNPSAISASSGTGATAEPPVTAAITIVKPPTWRERQENSAEYRKGEKFMDVKDYATAIVCFTEAIDQDPKNYAAYVLRSDCYRFEAKSDESDLLRKAVQDLTVALAHTEETLFDVSELYASRATALSRTGESENREKALADCAEAIRLKPESSRAYFTRASVYFAKGGDDNYEKAVRDCTAAIRCDPQNADAYYIRSKARRRIAGIFGDSSEADRDLEQAKRIDPKFGK
ncbi:MAG TPA: tetratricopeptide repeat protein [Chthoniobacteraceae bacterium]|nr:tetratricopeptide repeat protein [Chthoniobacteraceae bacterium]